MFVIGGAPRSGTSLLSSIISQVPGLAVAHDTGLFYYLKLAMLQVLAIDQYGKSAKIENLPYVLHRNNLQHSPHLAQFLDSSPRDLLCRDPRVDMCRKILDRFLALLWRFWTTNSLLPDPTKDRNNSNIFFEQLSGAEIMDSSSMRVLLSLLVYKYAVSMNNKDPHDYSLVVGEKTPENTVCGDLIESLTPGCRYINLYRDPVSVYGSKKRRMKLSPLEFCKWYDAFYAFRFINDDSNLIVKYTDILENPNQVLENVCIHLDIDDCSFGFSGKISPPSHYEKYIGHQIDPSREKYLQSLVNAEERALIYQNCTYPWW